MALDLGIFVDTIKNLFKVKVSSNDTQPDYLINKLTSSDASVTITETNDGGVEQIDLVASTGGGGVDYGNPFGIADSSGLYTTYSTFQSAINAASSGEVVEMFGDVTETSGVSIALKDGVNINLNGHTYTLNVATTENTITDNNVALSCTIYNGKIIRTGGTYSSANSLCLHVDNTSSVINLEGVEIHSDFGCTALIDGELKGGYYTNLVTTNISLYITSFGKLSNAKAKLSGDCRVGGQLRMSYIYSSGNVAIIGSGSGCVISHCEAHSDSSQAITINSGVISNCSAYSSASYAIWVQVGGKALNCSGYSTAGNGIYVFDSTAIAENCSGYSTAGNGIYNRQGRVMGCSGVSSAAPAFKVGTGYCTNCSAYCSWNNVGGHAYYFTGTLGTSELLNCSGQVQNAGANGVYCPASAYNGYFMNCSFRGCTNILNTGTPGVANLQTNTSDTYNNILQG